MIMIDGIDDAAAAVFTMLSPLCELTRGVIVVFEIDTDASHDIVTSVRPDSWARPL